MIETALYLIPVQLSDGELNCVLPQANIALVSHIKHFIVENVRSARRFLKNATGKSTSTVSLSTSSTAIPTRDK